MLCVSCRRYDKDEYAKRFDNFMYGFMLAHFEQLATVKYMKGQLIDTAVLLERKSAIPQIQAKMSLIKDIQSDDFWKNISILKFEMLRKELRDLMQFLNGGGNSKPKIFTKLDDPVINSQEGQALGAAYDFADYRKKVNRYVEEHKEDPVIYKLNHNLQLSKAD